MPALTGPLDALALVLLAAGVAKLAMPSATVPALRTVGLPGSTLVVRAVGLAEIVIGATTLALGGSVTAAATALAYVVFAVFSLLLLRRAGAQASCGCFGQASAPIASVHVFVNAIGAAVALGAVAFPVPGVTDALRELGWAAPAFVVLVGVLATVVRAALTAGAELQLAMRDLRSAA